MRIQMESYLESKNPDKWKYNPPMNPANAAPGAPPGGGPGTIGPIGMGTGMGGIAGMPHMQLPPAMQSGNIYDHPGVHPGVGMNGVGVPKPPPPGQPGPGELVYLGGQPHAAAAAALGMMPQNQFLSNQAAAAAAAANRNAAAFNVICASAFWYVSSTKSIHVHIVHEVAFKQKSKD
uniref:Uncharacterized protein n=1 Tax=Glossina austeni TaxID=7395 RepID=A0A1A9VN95_GLOAU